MNLVHLYLPQDRQYALLHQAALASFGEYSLLFCDISGFTPLTEALLRQFGPSRGAELLTFYLNAIYDALIGEIDAYGGSVIGFAGDAMTCLFPTANGALQATACALAMQATMGGRFRQILLPDASNIALAMKIAVVTGPVRRFLVGDPQIQVMDVLAGTLLDRMAAIERMAGTGDVLLDEASLARLGSAASLAEWRESSELAARAAAIDGLSIDLAEVRAGIRPIVPLIEIPDSVAARAWLLPPIYARLAGGSEQFFADVRPTVVLFVSFSGIDYDSDPAAERKLQTYVRWCQQSLAHYEGFLLQMVTGDKGSYFYAAFGAPLAHDDDPERAVAAALTLRDLPANCDFIEAVRIGISTGWVYAGAYGGRNRRTYGVLGDEVNMAARLMQAAAAGQVLVSQRIARAVANQYDLQSLGEIRVKGKTAPVAISAVTGRHQRIQAPGGLFVYHILVGRERELAWLDQQLPPVLAGGGRIVMIEGAAGVGKSQLLAGWSNGVRQRGVRVLAGMCQSVNQRIAYTPWRPIVCNLLNISPNRLPNLPLAEQIAQLESAVQAVNPAWLLRLPLLGDLLGIAIPDNPTTAAFDARLRQDSLFALIIDLLRMHAAEQPLMLRLEDVHWIDEASAALATAICRVIANQPILVCLTRRPAMPDQQPGLPELAGFDYYEHLVLNELDVAGVQALVEAGLRGPASPLLLSLVQNRAQGNPFFVEELVDALYEAGMLVHHQETVWTLAPAAIRKLHEARCIEYNRDGAMVIVPHAPLTDVLDLPDSVYSMVLARIDRLPELHRLTLKAASVIGQLFELDLLAHMYPLPLGPETLVEHLQALEQRDFMRSETPAPHATFAFRHNITQEVAYNTMLVEQRRSLHQAVGVVLEEFQPEAVERLAYHYSRSEVRDKMLHYIDKAARKSRYEYANETALQYYDQALQYEERWQWHYGRAAAYHVLGRRDEEERALQALDVATDVPQFAVGVLWGQYYEAVSDYEQAAAAFKRALADYRQRENQAGAARCLAQLGVVARRRGDYHVAAEWLEQAFALLAGADAAETVEGAQVYAQALNEMGTIHANQGRYEEARTCYLRALELSRMHSTRENEALALSNLGMVADLQRDFALAIGYYNASLEQRRNIGDRAGEGDSLYNTAIVVRQTGDYHSAQQYLRAVLDIYQAVSNRWGGVNAWNESGILYHELGKYDEATLCLQRGLKLSREIGDEAGEAYILANLGLVALDAGKPEEAEPALLAGLNLAQAQYDQWLSAIIFHYLSVNNLYLGNHRASLNYARTALNLRRELDLRPNEADDLAVMAVANLHATEYAHALDQAKHALAILDECQGEGPEFPQRDYFFCYQVFAANQDVARARHALQSAHQLVVKRAEKITDPALRHSFLENVPINRQIVEEMQRQK